MARFQPGHSGNPGGRPRQDPDVMRALRDMGPLAVRTIREILTDKSAPAHLRLRASEIVLDRVIGKAQPQDAAQEQQLQRLDELLEFARQEAYREGA